MTARPACQSARPLPDGGFPLVLGARAGLRQLALCILLFAFAALSTSLTQACGRSIALAL